MASLEQVARNAPRPLVILALALHTSRTQRILTFLLLIVCEVYSTTVALRASEDVAKGFSAFSARTGPAAFLLFAAHLLLVTKDPASSIRYLVSSSKIAEKDGSNGHGAATSNVDIPLTTQSLFPRFKWATSLVFNPRGVRTTAQIPGIRPLAPRAAASRTRFCLWRAFRALYGIITLVSLYGIVLFRPWLKNAILTTTPTLSERLAATAIPICAIYMFNKSGHAILACVTVALRIYEPSDWPDLFGSILDAYTVRRAWGTFWHQLDRMAFSSISDKGVKWIVPSSTKTVQRFVKICIAFTLSAWRHSMGDLAIISASEYDGPWWKQLFSYRLFLSQPFFILLESIVVAAAKKKGVGRFKAEQLREGGNFAWAWRVVGYVWVTFCFTLVLPEAIRPLAAQML